MFRTEILEHPENANCSIASEISVHLHECSWHRLYLLIELVDNIANGSAFPEVRKASYAKFIHHIFQVKAKFVKLLVMMHEVILKPSAIVATLDS
jgi:hypothetical protein